jgi:hypothetical protein
MYYVYIDYSAIPANSIIDSTDLYWDATEPSAYSVTKKGIYHPTNTDDRCIFGIYATAGTIVKFWHDGSDYVSLDTMGLAGQTAIHDNDYTDIDVDNAAWDDVYLPIPAFSTKALVTFDAKANADAGTGVMSWRVNGSAADPGQEILIVDSSFVNRDYNTMIVYTDSSKIFEVNCSVDGDHSLTVYVAGWYFPGGM